MDIAKHRSFLLSEGNNISNKEVFYNWVKKHHFFHVSELKNKEKILKYGLKLKENFFYSDNDDGSILDITDQGRGIVIFKIDDDFIQSIPIYPDPEHLENNLFDIAKDEAHVWSEEELDDIYNSWVLNNGENDCTWFFTTRKIPPKYLTIEKIYEEDGDKDEINNYQIFPQINYKEIETDGDVKLIIDGFGDYGKYDETNYVFNFVVPNYYKSIDKENKDNKIPHYVKFRLSDMEVLKNKKIPHLSLGNGWGVSPTYYFKKVK